MFVTLGISHKTASLAVREKLAFTPQEIPRALLTLKQTFVGEEVALVSTCNRTEIYAKDVKIHRLIDWWGQERQFCSSNFQSYLYQYYDADAVAHMMRVACGLDSLVVGEPQILGQLKEAEQTALEAGTLGKYLQRLFQNVFKVAKRVRTDTEIAKHPLSVASVAVRVAQQIFEHFKGITVLLLGAGKTSLLCAEHFKRQGVEHLIFAHRSKERALGSAAPFGALGISLEEIGATLPLVDIVIAATASPVPILGKGVIEHALKCRKQKPMFLIDLGVPRNIEPQAQDLEAVYLYTMDSLQELVTEHHQLRENCREQAEELISEQTREFLSWVRLQKVIPLLCTFRQTMEQITAQELALALSRIEQGIDPKVVVQKFAHHLSQKFLHLPTIRLKEEV